MYAAGVVFGRGEVAGDYSDYAIVMQGALVLSHQFTLETLRLYRRYYPDALLILSTWVGEDEKTIEAIRHEGVEVLLNRKPAVMGPRNINLQITSSVAGLRFAAEQKRRFALKTRTDMRMYNPLMLRFFSQALIRFPLSEGGGKQRGRLIGVFGSPYKWYFLSDILLFGYTEDVLAYFSASPVATATQTLSFGGQEVPFVPEQYFFTEFLKRIGYPLQWSEHDSRFTSARRTLVLDAETLDWYWYKYERHREYRHITYRRRKRMTGFPEWLTLAGDT